MSSQPQGSRLVGKVAIVTGLLPRHDPSLFPASCNRNVLTSHSLDLTGGASGFGAAIASRYAREGAKVVVCDINVAGGEKVASELPSNMSFLKMDVTKAEDWKAT